MSIQTAAEFKCRIAALECEVKRLDAIIQTLATRLQGIEVQCASQQMSGLTEAVKRSKLGLPK